MIRLRGNSMRIGNPNIGFTPQVPDANLIDPEKIKHFYMCFFVRSVVS